MSSRKAFPIKISHTSSQEQRDPWQFQHWDRGFDFREGNSWLAEQLSAYK